MLLEAFKVDNSSWTGTLAACERAFIVLVEVVLLIATGTELAIQFVTGLF